jgi:ABC-2 type transport system ATP-binding protein
VPDPILVSEKLTKDYGTVRALDGVDLEIREGEIFGLLGPNGAGKTTFLHVATTYLKPTAGTVRVAGFDVRTHAAEIRKILGVVPQEISLYDSLSGEENLEFFGGLYGLKGRVRKERVRAVLDLLGLAERGRDSLSKYSGGMKRRINIGAGILHEPKIILMDEPTVGVDPQSRHHIFTVIEGLRSNGATILYTTHYMEEAERLCDRIAIIDHGRVVACGTRRELVKLIGEESVLEIGVKGEVHPGAVEAVFPGADVREGRVFIRTADPAGALPGHVRRLTDAGLELASIQVLEPDLETVFLHLTGRRLRDGGAES